MRTGWGTLACGIVLGAAAGFVAGHLSAWTRAPAPHAPHPLFNATPDLSRALAADDADEGPVFFPEHVAPPAQATETVFADAVVDPVGDQHPQAAPREPAALPVPADAAPLSDDSRATLRTLLDAELADLTPADRDVWLDVLDGLPPADAVGIVRLWKKFGSGPGLLADSHLADALPETRKPAILLPTPTADNAISNRDDAASIVRDRIVDVPHSSQRAILDHARQVFTHNLLCMETFGFRRSEPLFGNPTASSAAAAPDLNAERIFTSPPPNLRIIGTRIDHRPGEILKSPSALDLAIEGDGFFVVTHPDLGEFFTRCGRFSRAPDGRLVLQTTCGELPVAPEIVIPDNAAALTFSADGEVTVAHSDGVTEQIGTLSLALFVAPAQLSPQNDALFSASERSGAAQIGRPSDGLRGKILQYHLERSNVVVPVENAWLRQIDEWVDLVDGIRTP